MTEKYYIEITFNEKVVVGTMLFNSEEDAVNWWEKVCSFDKHVKAYLLKETRQENALQTTTEIVRELK